MLESGFRRNVTASLFINILFSFHTNSSNLYQGKVIL